MTVPESLEGEPPSTKLVYKTLEYEGELRRSELEAETLLPAQTLREALTRLEDAGLIERRVVCGDARQYIYELS